jgi:electron transport complex protein RnfC
MNFLKRHFSGRSKTGTFPGSGSFAHGVHPPQSKGFSADAPIEIMPTPKKVLLPLLQHIGGPCTPLVKKGQAVNFGERVARGQAYVSASLHSPVNGVVQKVEVTTLSNGRHMQAIAIQSEGKQLEGQALWDRLYGGQWPQKSYQSIDSEDINAAVHDAGIVGLGGAAFPTHVKIMPSDQKPIHTLIVNGCECEPYLTTDYRLMVEAPDAIVAGALLAARAVGAKTTYIGIENNKLEAVASLRHAAVGAGIKIAVLKTKYPQGSEKHLIKGVLDREVPLGGLPVDIGVAMTNVATVTSVARAVMRSIPLTHRVVSVTGGGIVHPKNLLVPMGIAMGELIDYCGGLRNTAARIVAGGPMMGFAFTNPDTPVTKGTSGITVLTHEEIRKSDMSVCVRCGRCVDVCPMKLVPTKLAMAARYKDLNLARRYNISACFECGSCTYICPAGLPLVQQIRMGKALIAAEGRR